jgi:hypothetical protein
MDIKLLPVNLPPMFSFPTSALGKLFCFTLRVKDRSSLNEKGSESPGDSDWVKALISVSCNKERNLKEGKYKPDENDLSDDEVAQLTDEEIEEFSGLYVEKSSALSKFKSKNTQYEKSSGEANSSYLRRIYNAQNESLATSQLNKAMENSILGSKSAFSALSQFDKMTKAARATDILSGSTLASIAALRQKENEILKGFKTIDHPQIPSAPAFAHPPLSSSAQETVEQLKNMTELIVDSNEVQERIQGDITKAIKQAKVTTIISAGISMAVLILTLCGLWLANSASKSDSKQMNAFMDRLDKNPAAIVKPLENLNDSSKASHADYQKLIGAIDSLNSEVRKLREGQTDKKNDGRK